MLTCIFTERKIPVANQIRIFPAEVEPKSVQLYLHIHFLSHFRKSENLNANQTLRTPTIICWRAKQFFCCCLFVVDGADGMLDVMRTNFVARIVPTCTSGGVSGWEFKCSAAKERKKERRSTATATHLYGHHAMRTDTLFFLWMCDDMQRWFSAGRLRAAICNEVPPSKRNKYKTIYVAM